MSEEWCEIVIKADEAVVDAFKQGRLNLALARLAEFAGVDAHVIERSNAATDKTTCLNGYIYLQYECSDWVGLSSALTSKANNIEYYARHGDEYGTLSFFALNAAGSRLAFQFDEDGDAIEDPDCQDEVRQQCQDWQSMIPDPVKQLFPDFAELDIEEYIC